MSPVCRCRQSAAGSDADGRLPLQLVLPAGNCVMAGCVNHMQPALLAPARICLQPASLLCAEGSGPVLAGDAAADAASAHCYRTGLCKPSGAHDAPEQQVHRRQCEGTGLCSSTSLVGCALKESDACTATGKHLRQHIGHVYIAAGNRLGPVQCCCLHLSLAMVVQGQLC